MKRDGMDILISILATILLSLLCFHMGVQTGTNRERDTNDEPQRWFRMGTDGEGQDGRDGSIGGCPNAGEVPQSRPAGAIPTPAATRPVSRLQGAAPTGRRGGTVPVGGPERRLFNVSAYCQGKCCCGAFADGITASGKPVATDGGRFVAADRSIPFGVCIRVPGYAGGEAVRVRDRGGKITSGKLDVFFADDPGKPGSGHKKALQFGRQKLLCEVRESVR